MKKKLSLLICLSVVLLLLSRFESSKMFSSGHYFASAEGNNGSIKVEVVFSEDKIIDIIILDSNETKEVAAIAFTEIPNSILKNQSLNIEVISGATRSSEAIINAVKDCVIQAEGDLTLLNQRDVNKELMEVRVEKECDVVVIGAGAAGLTAAIEAKNMGANVLLLEKMEYPGGNTAISTGLYNAVDVKRQRVLGIQDSLELFFNDTYLGSDSHSKVELVKLLVEEASQGLEWLEKQGVVFSDEVIVGVGGITARSHFPEEGEGRIYTDILFEKCKELGIEILMETRADELLINEEGLIIGVEATNKGVTVIVNAKQGVILASGGFGANVDLRMKYDERLTGNILCSNMFGITGDGILMAEKVNANLIDMEYIQFYPYGDVIDGSLSNSLPNDDTQGIMVNASGMRFIKEDARRDYLSSAILNNKEGFAYMIIDKDALSNNKDNEYADGLVAMGRAVKANTIDELSKLMNVNSDNLGNTVVRYNLGVRNQIDELGRKTLNNQIDKPPFYATKRAPTIHYTSGGVEINEKAEVIDKQGNVIKNLYAAGEVTGGIHGPNRLGGNSLSDCIVFGRIAGANASQNNK